VGISALIDDSGYRNDGSYDPGTTIYLSQDDTLALVAEGADGFQYSTTISQGALQVLDTFLAACRARGIYVIGFVPPFSPAVYSAVISQPDHFGYMSSLSPDISAIFKKYNFAFYNFTNPTPLGITSLDMQDGLHVTERGSLIEFTKMAETNTTLGQYVDTAFLKNILATTTAQKNLIDQKFP
jgi:hypothetical protein